MAGEMPSNAESTWKAMRELTRSMRKAERYGSLRACYGILRAAGWASVILGLLPLVASVFAKSWELFLFGIVFPVPCLILSIRLFVTSEAVLAFRSAVIHIEDSKKLLADILQKQNELQKLSIEQCQYMSDFVTRSD